MAGQLDIERLNREVKISRALGIPPTIYEVFVYRITFANKEVFHSRTHLGVAAVNEEHAAAIVRKEEIDEDAKQNWKGSWADKVHHVKVEGVIDVSKWLALCCRPVRKFFPSPADKSFRPYWEYSGQDDPLHQFKTGWMKRT